MPNHCINCWHLSGPEDEIREFAAEWDRLVNSSNENDNPLNVIVAMPEELRGICVGSISINGKMHRRWLRDTLQDGSVIDVPLTPEQGQDLLHRFGAMDWRDWTRLNWGTKWGAYDADESGYYSDTSPCFLELYFNSAWGPPNKALEKLVAAKPDWQIKAAYLVDCFIGLYTAIGGKLDHNEYNVQDYTIDPPENMTQEEKEDWEDGLWGMLPGDKFTGPVLEIYKEFPLL